MDLSISEIEQFERDQVYAWQLGEFSHKEHSIMMRCNMDPWSMKIETYSLNYPRRKKDVVNRDVVFIENEAWKWDETHGGAIKEPGGVKEERGGDISETEGIEVILEENPGRSRSKYLNDNDVGEFGRVEVVRGDFVEEGNKSESETNREDFEVMSKENLRISRSKYLDDSVLFVEYVGLLCSKRDGTEESEEWTKAKSKELRNRERAEEFEEWTETMESEEWTKSMESEEWTEEIGVEDIKEVNFKLKGDNVSLSLKVT